MDSHQNRGSTVTANLAGISIRLSMHLDAPVGIRYRGKPESQQIVSGTFTNIVLMNVEGAALLRRSFLTTSPQREYNVVAPLTVDKFLPISRKAPSHPASTLHAVTEHIEKRDPFRISVPDCPSIR